MAAKAAVLSEIGLTHNGAIGPFEVIQGQRFWYTCTQWRPEGGDGGMRPGRQCAGGGI